MRIARSPSPPTAPTGTGDARIAALKNQLTQAARGRAISAVSVLCSIARLPADLSRRKRPADPRQSPLLATQLLSNTPLQRPQKLRPASLRDGRTKRWPLRSGFPLARTEDQCISRPRHERLPRRVATRCRTFPRRSVDRTGSGRSVLACPNRSSCPKATLRKCVGARPVFGLGVSIAEASCWGGWRFAVPGQELIEGLDVKASIWRRGVEARHAKTDKQS